MFDYKNKVRSTKLVTFYTLNLQQKYFLTNQPTYSIKDNQAQKYRKIYSNYKNKNFPFPINKNVTIRMKLLKQIKNARW